MAKILLVDDDPFIQSIYGRLLRSEGYEVYQADDAEKATEFLITRPVDLVLLDINMPGVDGAEMRGVIDAYDESLSVIVSSVYPLAEQKKRIPRAEEYFDKSHGTERLLELIKKVLGQKKSRIA